MKRFLPLMLLTASLLHFQLTAQVTLDPFFASQGDIVTVTYDATLGNGELEGAAQVFAHTGVITNLSTGPNDWRHVVGNWGTVDPVVQMIPQGNNIHTLVIDIENFYALQPGETVLKLAFVFRNADGSLVGRASDGGDIFVDLYSGGFAAQLTAPASSGILLLNHTTINLTAQSSESSSLSLYLDDSLLVSQGNTSLLNFSLNTLDFGPGKHIMWMEADNGQVSVRDSAYYMFHVPPTIAALPGGMTDGVNYLSDTSALLVFNVPFKNFIYLIGDFNNWEMEEDFVMNKTPDNNTHWIILNGLEAGKEYRYQYMVDQEQMRVADIYAHKILDPWNDPFIDNITYPDLISYPYGKTTHPVSVLQTAREVFVWDEGNYVRPPKEDLVIYELLIRDFVATHNYQTLVDTLDYLERLGVNAIGLMPFNEFEGNESWGYNPSFYFAPDKYYGTEEALKTFIQECHKRGIAVIMDMVLNHSFGQSPQVRLFFNPAAGPYGQPTAQNPWFRETPAHDFNVGYDFDHESPATKKFVDQVMRYWVEEFHIDGYRMDLSKGFTNNVTIGNVAAWGQYDASRVALLQRMADKVWEYDPEIYIILEHFANNDEEIVLSDYGFMLWGNMNHAYTEASMGYGGDLSWVAHTTRGWNNPHLVGYAESHDEERLMYKNLQFGKVGNDYSVRTLSNALDRAELSAVMLFGVPGPKMLWQFGELGYDYSINYCPDGTISENCRLSNKPIRWDYYQNPGRRRVYDVYAAMIKLHTENPTFKTNNFELDLNDQVKTIRLNHPEMNAVIVGNFDIVTRNVRPYFQQTGRWFEYFTGDSIDVLSTDDFLSLAPAEFRLYTDKKLELPEITKGINGLQNKPITLFPNPTRDLINIMHPFNSKVECKIFNLQGVLVQTLFENNENIVLDTKAWPNGMYFIEIKSGQGLYRENFIVSH